MFDPNNIREEFKLHSLAAMKTKKPKKKEKVYPVTAIKPNPDAWKLAMKLAGNDPKRIDVQSETVLVVRNSPWRAKKTQAKKS